MKVYVSLATDIDKPMDVAVVEFPILRIHPELDRAFLRIDVTFRGIFDVSLPIPRAQRRAAETEPVCIKRPAALVKLGFRIPGRVVGVLVCEIVPDPQ